MNSITNIFIEIWLLSKEMAPYLLLGFILAGILSQLISKKIIKKHLCKQNKFGVLKGVLFGIPMPICSCYTYHDQFVITNMLHGRSELSSCDYGRWHRCTVQHVSALALTWHNSALLLGRCLLVIITNMQYLS